MRPLTLKQLLSLLVLAALNVWLSLLAYQHSPRVGGPVATALSAPAVRDRLLTFGFTLPLLGWLLGLLAAFVPYRGWPYRTRLVTFSLTLALALHLLAFGWLAVRLLRWPLRLL